MQFSYPLCDSFRLNRNRGHAFSCDCPKAEQCMTPQRNGVPKTGMRPPLFDVTLEYSYTAAGKAKFRGADFSDSDAYNVRLGLRTRAQLNKH